MIRSLHLRRYYAIGFYTIVCACLGLQGCSTLPDEANTPETARQLTPALFNATCSATVFRPAQWTSQTQRVLVFDSSPIYENIPAEMAWREIKIQVEPARHRYETRPAEYDEITEYIEVERPRTELYAIPAQYRLEKKRIQTQEAHQRWKKGCLADTRQCLETVPAQFTTLDIQTVQTPAKIAQRAVPGKNLAVKRKVVRVAGEGYGGIIPARYQTVRVSAVKRPWEIKTEHRPARYETITLQQRRPEQVFSIAAVCETSMQSTHWLALQTALQQQGYPVSPTGQANLATRQALLALQADQQLAMGAITLETLRKLGLR